MTSHLSRVELRKAARDAGYIVSVSQDGWRYAKITDGELAPCELGYHNERAALTAAYEEMTSGREAREQQDNIWSALTAIRGSSRQAK